MKFFFADSRFSWRSVRRCSLLLCALLLIPLASFAQDTPSGFFPGAINIFAGTGGSGNGVNDGSSPTSGNTGTSYAVAVDSEGDVVFGSSYGVVYMVYAGGTVPPILAAVTTNASTPVTPVQGDIYVVAGFYVTATCRSGSYAATSTGFKKIYALWFDSNDNLYIADNQCYSITEIDHATATSNVIAGIPGSQSSYTTTGGNSQINGQSPTSIKLGSVPYGGVKTDSYGNVYITDVINRVAYVIYTTTASAPPPVLAAEGVTNPVKGNIYVIAGIVKQNCTVASTSPCPQYGPAEGTSPTAVDSVYSVFVDAAGNLYFTDAVENVLRVLYVGNGNGAVPPVLVAAGFTNPTVGNIYVVAGTYSSTAITSCASTGHGTPCGDGGLATAATFYNPTDVNVDSAGNVYIADYYDNAIRKIDTSGYISTIAGVAKPKIPSSKPTTPTGGRGAATSATLYLPTAIAFDSTQSNLYIADGNTVLWQVAAATPQTITFPSLATPVTYGSQITLGATTSSSLDASYTVSPSASGSVNGSGTSALLSVKGVGSISVTASQGTASGGSTAVTSASGTTTYYAPTTAAENVTQTITAQQAPLTVTANNVNLTPTQLASFNFSTGFSATISGEVNGDTDAAAYSGAPAFTTNATAAATCGVSYTITPSINTLTSTNYYFPSANFINGTLIVTGTTTQTINLSSTLPSTVTYGKTTTVPLSATTSSGGAVTWTLLSGPGSVTGSTLTINGAGTIKVQGVQNGTCAYAASPTVTYTLTVNPAPLTVTAPSPSYPYGTNITASLDATAPTITGWVGSDTSAWVSGKPTYTTNASSTSDPGSFTLTPAQGKLAIASSVAGNYTFSTFAPGTITITKASQTINYLAAYMTNVTYGGTPTITTTSSAKLPITGSVTGPLTYTPSYASPVTNPSTGANTLEWTATGIGAATITLTQAGNTDYAAATLTLPSFTIGQAPLDITATSFTREQGAPNPTLTYTIGCTNASCTIGGFVNGDIDVLSVMTGVPTLTTTATQASSPGTYAITVDTSAMTSTNYYFVPINGKLTVGPAGSYTLSFINPDSTTNSSTNPLTIKSGQSGQLSIILTPSNEYQGTITLTCGALPANVTCTISPSTFTFTGEFMLNGYVEEELQQMGTITINTTSATVVGSNARESNLSLAGFLIPGALAGLFLVFARKRVAKIATFWSLCALLALGVGATLGLTSCAGSSVNATAATGTQTITITGTGTTPSGSGSVTATAPLTVTIQ